MRRFKIFMLTIIIAGALVFSGYSIYEISLDPCDKPLEYSIGRFDKEFGVSEQVFLSEIAEAEKIWENTLGRDHFVYKPGADFKINLIYDTRQIETMQKQKTESGLSSAESVLDNLDQKFGVARFNYENAKSLHESRVASFDQDREAYEVLVNEWNSKGGAPPSVYEKLQAQAVTLNSEANLLNQEAVSLNKQAEELNALLDQRNQAARSYNQVAKSYNQKYGPGLEFNQAEYTGEAINIYQFGSEGDLVLALTHEFGHALGMDHVETSGSVMYYITSGDEVSGVKLSADDLVELGRVCKTK